MKDKLEKLYEVGKYAILVLIVILSFFIQAIRMDKPIIEYFYDWQNIVYSILNAFAGIAAMIMGSTTGIDYSLAHPDFIEAEKKNKEAVKYFNDNSEKVLKVIYEKNKMEKKLVQQDFLLSRGVTKEEELSKRDLKKFKKLKHDKYTTKGLTNSLYYTGSRGRTKNFDASYNDGNTFFKSVRKVIKTLILPTVSINTAIRFTNIGDALKSSIILAITMAAIFLFEYITKVSVLLKVVPKKAAAKYDFYEEVKNYKLKEENTEWEI